jgi:hypothetical protein
MTEITIQIGETIVDGGKVRKGGTNRGATGERPPMVTPGQLRRISNPTSMTEITITNTGGAAMLQDGDTAIRFATIDGTPIEALLDALDRRAEQRKTPTLGLLAEGMRFHE